MVDHIVARVESTIVFALVGSMVIRTVSHARGSEYHDAVQTVGYLFGIATIGYILSTVVTGFLFCITTVLVVKLQIWGHNNRQQ